VLPRTWNAALDGNRNAKRMPCQQRRPKTLLPEVFDVCKMMMSTSTWYFCRYLGRHHPCSVRRSHPTRSFPHEPSSTCGVSIVSYSLCSSFSHQQTSCEQRIASWLLNNYPNATMSAVQLGSILRSRGIFAFLGALVRRHPILSLLFSNAATSTAVVYVGMPIVCQWVSC